MTIECDVLIQNVSAQCIPNLVAARTFRPRRLVWVHTPEFRETLDRLRKSASGFVEQQDAWQVDARDVEALHETLLRYFQTISPKERIIYHLTGGTKSMSLQGLYNLGTFRREHGADVLGVVMNPRTQHFDVIYPRPANRTTPCVSLSLDEMLIVHGNAWDDSHAYDDIGQCRQLRDVWERMRKESRELRRVWKANDMRALHDRPPKSSFRHFRCVRPIPKRLKSTLALLQSHGLLSGLRYPAPDQVCYKQHGQDIIKLIAGGWLERWLGAVLADAGIAWRGARVSAKVLEKGGGSQEFDFLGAHRNHLVYWSCKTDAKLTNDKLFEVDALRDGIAGSDFHIAGLLHTASIMPTMRAKARRMNLHMVCALEDDAAAQVVRISGG